jgi:hypothetical protein
MMKLKLSMVLLLSLPSWAFAAHCNKNLVKRVGDAFEGGKQVLILAWSDKNACGSEDEACGDWADRLNQFQSRQKDKLEIFKISPKQWGQVIDSPISKVPLQSSLFLWKGKPSYFHSGAILEYDVYQAVLDSWNDKKAPQTSQFLPEKMSVSLCK